LAKIQSESVSIVFSKCAWSDLPYQRRVAMRCDDHAAGPFLENRNSNVLERIASVPKTESHQAHLTFRMRGHVLLVSTRLRNHLPTGSKSNSFRLLSAFWQLISLVAHLTHDLPSPENRKATITVAFLWIRLPASGLRPLTAALAASRKAESCRLARVLGCECVPARLHRYACPALR
jgi:hypothetical protein